MLLRQRWRCACLERAAPGRLPGVCLSRVNDLLMNGPYPEHSVAIDGRVGCGSFTGRTPKARRANEGRVGPGVSNRAGPGALIRREHGDALPQIQVYACDMQAARVRFPYAQRGGQPEITAAELAY